MRQFVREVAPLGHLDRVHFADQIGDGDVRRRQLLTVARVARNPMDWRVVALLGHAGWQALQMGSNGSSLISQPTMAGIFLVEQVHQAARDACLGLAALAEQDDILPGEDGVLNLRDDGLLIADDAGEYLFASAHLPHQVLAHLVLDGKHAVATIAELPDGGCFVAV